MELELFFSLMSFLELFDLLYHSFLCLAIRAGLAVIVLGDCLLVDLYFLFDSFEVDAFLECFLFFVHFHVGPVHGKNECLS